MVSWLSRRLPDPLTTAPRLRQPRAAARAALERHWRMENRDTRDLLPENRADIPDRRLPRPADAAHQPHLWRTLGPQRSPVLAGVAAPIGRPPERSFRWRAHRPPE